MPDPEIIAELKYYGGAIGISRTQLEKGLAQIHLFDGRVRSNGFAQEKIRRQELLTAQAPEKEKLETLSYPEVRKQYRYQFGKQKFKRNPTKEQYISAIVSKERIDTRRRLRSQS